jgi:hypothetical protein
MANGWTLERRQRQAQIISDWKPWEQSTGARTLKGKATVAANAWRGGHRAQLRVFSKMVNEELRQARSLLVGCSSA